MLPRSTKKKLTAGAREKRNSQKRKADDALADSMGVNTATFVTSVGTVSAVATDSSSHGVSTVTVGAGKNVVSSVITNASSSTVNTATNSSTSAVSTIIADASSSAVSSTASETTSDVAFTHTFFRSRTDLARLKNGESPSKFNNYPRLTHDFEIHANTIFICDGVSRESILVDMNSAELDKYFNDFIKDLELNEALTQSQSQHENDDNTHSKRDSFFTDTRPSQFLSQIAVFVNETFTMVVNEEKIKTIVKNYRDTLDAELRDKIDYVPLEVFIAQKTGFCRHHVLVVSYLLARLNQHIAKINETSVESTKVYRYRSRIVLKDGKSSAHTVVVYEDDNGQRFFIDSTRRLTKETGVALLIAPAAAMDETKLTELVLHYLPLDLMEFIAGLNKTYNALNAPLTASASSSSSSSCSKRLTF